MQYNTIQFKIMWYFSDDCLMGRTNVGQINQDVSRNYSSPNFDILRDYDA